MRGVLWPDLTGRRVLLAVTGGIAAYKAAELCRLLVRCGARVRVMMTPAAQQFVGATTFAALSGQPVATDMFDPVQEAQINHIDLADEAELLVVAPATADVLATMAHGLAGDLVGTVLLAHAGPVLLAPAMNVKMWENPATQANVALLKQRGHRLVGPEAGDLACGHVGAGRMAEPDQVLQAVGQCVAPQDLAGRQLLISAGPTREAIDPVRFVGNRSSGKMGYALAAEAAARGAVVTLVSGPTALAAPLGVCPLPVVTAAQMADAVLGQAGQQDAIIMAAAVADFRPVETSAHKLGKKTMGSSPAIALEPTQDVLAALGQRWNADDSRRPLLVGFAAQAGPNAESQGLDKLRGKGCDLMVINDVGAPDAGFDVDTNRVTIADRSGGSVEALPLLSKRRVAAHIIDRLAQRLRCRKADGA